MEHHHKNLRRKNHFVKGSQSMVFSRNFLFVAKVAIIHRKMLKKEKKSAKLLSLRSLAKYGYNPDMRYKSLIIFLYLWLYTLNQI